MLAHAKRFIADLEFLARERHPDGSPEALRNTAQYLAERFSALGLAISSHQFPRAGTMYRNVIATTPDDLGLAKPPLVLAAHYDTVVGSPGADDNASALAVLLDVADQLTGRTLSRPVQFIAFCLEEENLLGSRAYAAHLKASGQSIQAAVVLECVGYASHEAGTQAIPPGVPVPVPTTGNFLAVIGNEPSHKLTAALERAMSPHLPIVPLIVPGHGEALPDTRRSDHTAFWEAGFPAVMLTDTANFRNPHYHLPSDTVDTLNRDFMAAVAEGVLAAVLVLTGGQDCL
ncbi:MAG: M28 family peptidase [Nitrospiraceae bacterium]|nr:M28 family peptidase [Nitrospiraceae bacterium]